MKKILMTMCLLMIVSACTPIRSLTPGGELIKVVTERPDNCRTIGSAIDTMGDNLSYEQSWNFVRNSAAARGANTIRVVESHSWSHGGAVIGPNQFHRHRAWAMKCER
ncbi:MAG: DUF4156 domain-containing protein [Alphaproteobacteria bacterium]|nr:DUF4156 domain-containing protein [Alphaproteobacteria bacterium]